LTSFIIIYCQLQQAVDCHVHQVNLCNRLVQGVLCWWHLLRACFI